MATKMTVSKKWLEHYAASIEKSATDAQTSWILLGQYDKYGEQKMLAWNIRRAAQIKNISERRNFLRDLGVSV